MTSVMAGHMASGAAGNDPFYLKAQVAMKHFTVYQAEWDREVASNHIGCRSLYEWHYPVFFHAVKDANVIGVMTSYGATNEIPNACSPFVNELNTKAPYGLYNISDFGADSYLLRGMGNNGLISYASKGYQIAGLMIKTGALSNNINKALVDSKDYIQAVNEGLYGVTREDMEELIRPQIEIWVRTGYFNPQKYPYTYTPGKNYKNVEHQKLAMLAAEEGLVLLKNENNLLPLDTKTSVVISGQFADLRTQPMYTAETPPLKHAGISPLEMIRIKMEEQEGSVIYEPEMNGKLVLLKDACTGKYFTWNKAGEIVFTEEKADAKIVQIWDWGQEAYSLVDILADSCLQIDETGIGRMVKRDKSKMMPVFTYEEDNNGKKCLRSGCIITSPFTQLNDDTIPFYQYYTERGGYLTEREGHLVIGDDLGVSKRNEWTHLHLEELEVTPDILESCECKGGADHAIIFIGEEARTNASEMKDRQDMKFGEMQIVMAKKMAERFLGKTVVVVRSDFPMEMEELHDDPNIGAILYASYGGQYDSKAIIECLFGEISPGGRLTTTWVKNHQVLPALNRTDSIDKQYHVDMKAVDAEEYGLTYRYMTPDKWQYPFGYGLSY